MCDDNDQKIHTESQKCGILTQDLNFLLLLNISLHYKVNCWSLFLKPLRCDCTKQVRGFKVPSKAKKAAKKNKGFSTKCLFETEFMRNEFFSIKLILVITRPGVDDNMSKFT